MGVYIKKAKVGERIFRGELADIDAVSLTPEGADYAQIVVDHARSAVNIMVSKYFLFITAEVPGNPDLSSVTKVSRSPYTVGILGSEYVKTDELHKLETEILLQHLRKIIRLGD